MYYALYVLMKKKISPKLIFFVNANNIKEKTTSSELNQYFIRICRKA